MKYFLKRLLKLNDEILESRNFVEELMRDGATKAIMVALADRNILETHLALLGEFGNRENNIREFENISIYKYPLLNFFASELNLIYRS